jgi:hypothetical protein
LEKREADLNAEIIELESAAVRAPEPNPKRFASTPPAPSQTFPSACKLPKKRLTAFAPSNPPSLARNPDPNPGDAKPSPSPPQTETSPREDAQPSAPTETPHRR